MKELRLPDKSYTDNVDLFNEEWDKLCKPFEKLGFQIIGFDPGIALCDEETKGGYFILPIYAARRFVDEIVRQQHDLDTLQANFTALEHAIVGDTGRSALLEVEMLKECVRRYNFLCENL